MKRVSEKQLARMALAKGATIQFNGRRINASGERADIADQTTQPAAPAQAPAETSIERAVMAQQQSIDKLIRLVESLLEQNRHD